MSRQSRPIMKRDTNGLVIPQSGSYYEFRGEYDVSNNLIYAGTARPGAGEDEAKWQIKKLTYDVNNNLTEMKYPQDADGNPRSDFDFVWDDRASYTFS